MFRHGSPLLTILLTFLVGSMLLVRVVDLHWHQHLGEPLTSVNGNAMPLTYIADASTPHLPHDQDHDVRMFGDDGSAQAVMPLPPAWPVALVVLLPLLLLLLPPSRIGLRPERASPPGLYRQAQLPPPLRGPPR